MKYFQIAISVTVALLLQAPVFAALTTQDSETIAAIDNVANMPDDKLPSLMESCAQLINKDPNNFRIHFILARAYDRLGMEDLQKSEDARAEAAGEPFKNFVRSALQKKVISSDFSGAKIYLPFAEKYFPKDASVAITQAVDLHGQGKIAESEKLLADTLHEGKHELGIMTALGGLKLEKGEYGEAVKMFDSDLVVDPRYEPALLGKAKAFEQLRLYVPSLNMAVPIYLSGGWTRNELAALVTSDYCHLARYKDGLQPALVSLAVARRQSEMDRAKKAIQFIWTRLTAEQRQAGLTEVCSVLDKTIWGARLHFALGDALQQAGYLKDAELQFRAGLKLEPKHGRAYLHLAEIYQDYYHNKPAAILNYMRYCSLSGNDPAILSRIARLSQEVQRKGDIALRIKNRLKI